MNGTKGKNAYNNGINNRYFLPTDIIPDGYVKGALSKKTPNKKFKFNWYADNIEHIIIDLLKRHHGNISQIENEIGIKTFRKGMKCHFPHINILDYVPNHIKFHRDKTYAICVYKRCHGDLEAIGTYLSLTVKSVRMTLIRHGIGMLPTDTCDIPNVVDNNNDIQADLSRHLMEYVGNDRHCLLMNRYLNFVMKCDQRNRQYNQIHYEKHHILPSSLYPKYRNFRKYQWNMALLTSREHFIAHLILHYFIGHQMTMAMNFMLRCDRYNGIAKSKQYALIRQEYKNSSTLDTKVNLGKKLGKWYTDGMNNKRIKDGMPIPNGYQVGLTLSPNDESTIIKKTEKNKQICIELLKQNDGNIHCIMNYFDVKECNAYVTLRRLGIKIIDYQPLKKTYIKDKDIAMKVYHECSGDWGLISEKIGVQVRTIKRQYEKRYGIT